MNPLLKYKFGIIVTFDLSNENVITRRRGPAIFLFPKSNAMINSELQFLLAISLTLKMPFEKTYEKLPQFSLHNQSAIYNIINGQKGKEL